MTKEEITKYIFLEDIYLRSDIAFVFGTSNSWKDSVKKTVELYNNKTIPKMIFSGGANKKTGLVECEIMAKEAIKLGISKKDILIEKSSTNTLENVLFSINIINEEIGLQNIKTITAVVKNYHARRALMTLKKHMPQHIQLRVVSYTSDYYPLTKENWHQSDEGRKKVFEEIEKIKIYLAKGDIAEL